MEQPIGFTDAELAHLVCLLGKALYGLKQSAREWQHWWAGKLAKYGLKPIAADQSIYVGDGPIVLVAHIDDMLVFGPKLDLIKALKAKLDQELTLQDLGDAQFFLGIEILRDRARRTLKLTQRAYAEKILAKYSPKVNKKALTPCLIGLKLEQNTEHATPQEIQAYQEQIGALIYL
jgi:hypothetical protein